MEKWITINGRHVLLKDGQSPMDAFIRQKGKDKKINEFDKSKVVDENGQILTMYHGTTDDFDKFDEKEIREVDYDAPFNGFWFSSDENTSPAMRNALHTKQVYLNITNPAPYGVWNEVSKQVDREMYDSNGEKPKTFNLKSRSTNDEVRYRLLEKGYDGIHWDGKPTINKSELEKKGKTTFTSVSGRSKYTLEKGNGEYTLKNSNGEYITSFGSVEEYLNIFNEEWVAFKPNQIKIINQDYKRK